MVVEFMYTCTITTKVEISSYGLVYVKFVCYLKSVVISGYSGNFHQ